MAFRWVFRRPRDYRIRRKRLLQLVTPLTMDSPVCFAAGQVYLPGFKAGEVYQPGFKAGDTKCSCD